MYHLSGEGRQLENQPMSDEVERGRHQVHHPVDDHNEHGCQNERDGNFRRHHRHVVRTQTVQSGRSFARENPTVISHYK